MKKNLLAVWLIIILIVYLNVNQKHIEKMKTLKQKVEDLLIKWGNNPDEVKEMVALHFEVGARVYTSARTIAEYVRTVY